jgi:hypothetical protein
MKRAEREAVDRFYRQRSDLCHQLRKIDRELMAAGNEITAILNDEHIEVHERYRQVQVLLYRLLRLIKEGDRIKRKLRDEEICPFQVAVTSSPFQPVSIRLGQEAEVRKKCC